MRHNNNIESMMNKKEQSQSYKYLAISSFYILTMMIFFGLLIPLVFFDFSSAPLVAVIFAIVGAICLAVIIVCVSIFFIKHVNKNISKEYRDYILIFLILIFVFLSLLVSALITKFSGSVVEKEKLESMVHIAWAVYGVSISIFLSIIALPNIILVKNKKKQLAIDIIQILYPNLASVAFAVLATIMFYYFYDDIPEQTYNFISNFLMTTVLCVPFYLIAGIHLFNKYLSIDAKDENK